MQPGRERRLMNQLFGEQGWLKDAHNLDEETAQCVEQLRSYLTEMAESSLDADSDEPETIDRFRERLNRRLQMPVLMRRTPGGVLLAPMHTMHGLRFRHVAVGGLSEGEFPAGRRSGELLNDAMRESLKDAGLQLPLAPRSTEDELWQSVTSRSDDSTALWRYRLNSAGKEATRRGCSRKLIPYWRIAHRRSMSGKQHLVESLPSLARWGG